MLSTMRSPAATHRALRRCMIGAVLAASSVLACGSSHESSDGGSAHDAEEEAPHDAGQEVSAFDSSLPYLAALDVSGAASGITPAFSPGILDYYVACAAGTSSLTVTMTASRGALASITGPTMSPAKSSQTVVVDVDEGGAIVAAASAGMQTTAYWIRCLPHDFPALAMSTYPDSGTPPPGYYLVGNAVVAMGERGYAMILDGNGVPVWFEAALDELAVSNVGSPAVGTISFIPTSFVAYEPYSVVATNPLVSEAISPMGYNSDEHELTPLPNGHYLTFSYVLKPGVDLTGLSIPIPGDAGSVPLGPNSTIQDCVVLEIDEAGHVYWTWSATDHFIPAEVSTYAQTGFGPDAILPDGGATYDIYHCTSIDVDPANGNILVSARGTDSAFYIERPSGRVLWKLGGVDESLDNAAYVSVDDPFFEERDVRLLAGWRESCNGGTGQVSVFDDETTTGAVARGAVYDIVVGGSDGSCADAGPDAAGAPGKAVLVWQFRGLSGSGGGGSMRILADGSRVIGWGISTPVFTEVDEAGNRLKELEFLSGDVSYRAIKVPLSSFDLAALHRTAGM
jgi:Arylsulfotransferase (ASST)